MNVIKIITITSVILSLNRQVAQAQQEPLYTHYMFNPLSINAGYAGAENGLEATLLYRAQWIDIEGAPVTQSFTAHTPLSITNLGAGISIINDRIGPQQSTVLHLDGAYHIPLNTKTRLGLGLKTSLDFWRVNLTGLIANNPGDPLAMEDKIAQTLLNFGVGAYLSGQRYFLGLAIPRLLKNNKGTDATTTFSRKERHYFLSFGYTWKIRSNIEFRPSLLAKAVSGAPLEADITCQWMFYDKFSAGFMYRTGADIGLLIQYWIIDQLRVGYAYDYGLNDLGKFHQGSHEWALTYRFVTQDVIMRPPRSF